MARRSSPEVNAGSMADIAFLLLIFFLVTTTIETDSGISRKLPPMEESEEDVVIKQKNIFTVLLNGKDQLLVEDELMELEDLREAAISFLDNGGGSGYFIAKSLASGKPTYPKPVDSVEVRSPLTCETKRGICSLCYGRNLATRKNLSKCYW